MVRLKKKNLNEEHVGDCQFCEAKQVPLYDAGAFHLCKECFEGNEIGMGRPIREIDRIKK